MDNRESNYFGNVGNAFRADTVVGDVRLETTIHNKHLQLSTKFDYPCPF